MSSKEPTEVETSPDRRYIRFDKKLGHGAYKSVWLGLDTEQGIEVAWNTVTLGRLPERERTRLSSETSILQSLSHANIIEFYDVWDNPAKDEIVFTSEYVSSGTLKEFTRRAKDRVKLKVVKKWCRQILHGLHYLHTRKPPIIHRDLKCDNIFINGSTGDIRIGDLGLSTERADTQLQSVLGTPEFMAPEMYDESYNEMVDIYAFGMVVLELCTNEYPYQECRNPAQIYKKVCAGLEPDVLRRITDERVASFIRLCLAHKDLRPNAEKLLDHPFLKFKSCYVSDRFPVSMEDPDADEDEVEDDKDEKPNTVIKKTQPPSVAAGTGANADAKSTVNTFIGRPQVKVERADAEKANIALKLPCGDGRRRVVKFQFDFVHDTPEAIAKEMCTELKLPPAEYVNIYDSIKESVDRERDGISALPSDTGDERAEESELSDGHAHGRPQRHPPPPASSSQQQPPPKKKNPPPPANDGNPPKQTRTHETNTVVEKSQTRHENTDAAAQSSSPAEQPKQPKQQQPPPKQQLQQQPPRGGGDGAGSPLSRRSSKTDQPQQQPAADGRPRSPSRPVAAIDRPAPSSSYPPSDSASLSPSSAYSPSMPPAPHTSSRLSSPEVQKFRKKLEKAKIHELKRKIASLGGDSSKCLEKKELVTLAVTLALNQLKEAEARKAAKQARHHPTPTDSKHQQQPTPHPSTAHHHPPQKSHDSSKHHQPPPSSQQQHQQSSTHFPTPSEPSGGGRRSASPDHRRVRQHHAAKREPLSGEHLLSVEDNQRISDMKARHQLEIDADVARYRQKILDKKSRLAEVENQLRVELIAGARDRHGQASKVAISAASSPGTISSPVSSAASRAAPRAGVTSPASAPSQAPQHSAKVRSRPPTPTGSPNLDEVWDQFTLGASRSGLSTPVDSEPSTPVTRARQRSASSRSSSPGPQPATPRRGQRTRAEDISSQAASSAPPSPKDDVILLPYTDGGESSSSAAAPSGQKPALRRERSLRRERDMNVEAQAALSGRAAPDRNMANGHASTASGTASLAPADSKHAARKSKNTKDKKDKFSSRTAKAMKATMGNGTHVGTLNSNQAKPGTASSDSAHLPGGTNAHHHGHGQAAGGGKKGHHGQAAGGSKKGHHPKSRATIPPKSVKKKGQDEQEAQLAEERLLSQLFGDSGAKRVPMSGVAATGTGVYANGHMNGTHAHMAGAHAASSTAGPSSSSAQQQHQHVPSSSPPGSSVSSAASSSHSHSHASMNSMKSDPQALAHSHSMPSTSSSPPSPPPPQMGHRTFSDVAASSANGNVNGHLQHPLGAGVSGANDGPMTSGAKQRARGARHKKASMKEIEDMAKTAARGGGADS